MKIGIMADSHENMPMIRKAVELFNFVAEKFICQEGGDERRRGVFSFRG